MFLTSLGLTVSAQAKTSSTSADAGTDYFILYQAPDGHTICREANAAERADIDRNRPKNYRQINHLDMHLMAGGEPQSDHHGTHLTIILRATPALEANAPAKAAFERAADAWEAVIH